MKKFKSRFISFSWICGIYMGIIMTMGTIGQVDGRKDGQQVTWKWLQENQQIPYSEFTKFYTDLSLFIEGQREGYFNIEKQCQVIANQNNTLLDTFPNNIYNKVLSCERIKFEYGFTSDSTETVFKKKIEN